MAFCDNPKCRLKNFNGKTVVLPKFNSSARYFKTTETCVYSEFDTVEIKNHRFIDDCAGNPIERVFCDECKDLVEKAEKRLRYIKNNYKLTYYDYLNDHGDNLLLHFVQSEWFARENANKKSPF